MLELKEAMIVSEEFDGTSKDDIRTDVLNKIYDVAKETDWGYLDQDEIDEFLMPRVDVTDTEDGRVRVEVRAEYSDYDAQRKMGEALDEIIRKYDEDAYFDDEEPGIMSAYLDVKLNESLTEDTNRDLYVIVNPDDGELFTRIEKAPFGRIARFTSYTRGNYDQAKTFSSEVSAQSYLDERKDVFNKYKENGECYVTTYADAISNLGDIDARQAQDKAERDERNRANRQAYQDQRKLRNAETKAINPGKYRVIFYYSTRSLGSEMFTVDAQSIDDAFDKAKQIALRQDPYRDTPDYDQRMNFNKNNIYKIDEALSFSGATQASNIGQHKRASIGMTEESEINPEDSEMIKSLDKMTEGIADRVRASQDIKEMTRRSIQILGNYVRYYKDHPEEIDDSNRTLVSDTEIAYDNLKSEYEETYGTSLDEAYYGGAYDIDPEMYFTRDDYVDFANQIIDEVEEDTDVNLELDDINVIDNKHVRFVFFSVMDTYTTDVYIDYRRVRNPSDLSRYLDAAVKDIEGKINEYRGMYEGLQLKLDESINDFNEYSGNVTYNAYKTIADMRKYLKSHPDSKSDINSLRNQVRDIYANAYLESLHESLEGEDGWGEEISDLFYDFLRETDSLAYEIRNTVRGAETGARTVSELVVWLGELSNQLEDIIGNLEGSEDVLEESADKPLRVCQSCLQGIESHEGPQKTKVVYIDNEDTYDDPAEFERDSKCDWCEDSGFDKLYELESVQSLKEKVSFKDNHICQGCGKPLSQCTCEVEEESLELDHV